MYLSSVLKQHGHETDFFDIGLEGGIEEYVQRTRPAVIGYSVTTGSHQPMFETNRRLKAACEFTSVFGGPHATYHPECIEEEGVDAVCRGEAEEAFAEFVDTLAAGGDVGGIANFWVKQDGRILRNDVRPLREDLDALPFPDRDLLDRYPQYARLASRRLLTARGCPFNCTYCYNKALSELYRGKGKKLRRRSVDNVITELRELYARVPVHILHISDDTFIINKEWLSEFADRYEPLGVPVTCYARAEFIDAEVARALRRIRCTGLHVGVESANEETRRKYMNRKMSNEVLERAVRTAKAEGLPVVTQNMLGLPGEDLKLAMNTLRFNARLRPAYAGVSIFQPYPGTELARAAQDMGLVTEQDLEFPTFFWRRSLLKLPDVREMENLAHLFSIAVEYPPVIPLVELLVRLPRNVLFRFAGALFKAYAYMVRLGYIRIRDITLWWGPRTLKAT
jgi:radical SAM superfamily enzyme YgiQ (UPF0313 family)